MNIKNIIVSSVIVTLGALLGAVGGSLIVLHNQPAPQAGGLGAILNGVASTTATTVTTSNTTIAATSTSRQYLSVVNAGSNPVYISIGVPAVVGAGIYLAASGGSYEINDQNLFTGAIFGIATGGSSNVTVLMK